MRRTFLVWLLFVWCGGVSACAATVSRHWAATATPLSLVDCIRRARAAGVAVHNLRVDLRLVVFGPEGRLRSRAEIWLSRPDKLRYTLIGPQGGPLFVVTCDGQTLRSIDLSTAHWHQAPATADAFDAWLAPLRLHLEAAAWVRLLLGELEVPDAARFSREQPAMGYALSWQAPAEQMVRGEFSPETGYLQKLQLCQGTLKQSEVIIVRRTAAGVPEALKMRLWDTAQQTTSDVEIGLQQVDLEPLIRPETFALPDPSRLPVTRPPP